jgi:prepilin-type N-terminal cleavage/methylation domain-containing protein
MSMLNDDAAECPARACKQGFTLVELLVVAGILALLMALLLPAVQRARDRAFTIACISKLRHTGAAVMQYAADHEAELPYDTTLTSWSASSNGYGLPHDARMRLSPYLGRPFYVRGTSFRDADDFMFCPAYSFLPDGRGHQPRVAIYTDDVPTTSNFDARSYRINDWLNEFPHDHDWSRPWSSPNDDDKEAAHLHQIRSPQRLIVVAEGYNKNLFDHFNELYFNPRHGDKCPAVRADGSVHHYEDERNDSSGFLWSPNHGVNSTYTVETWGTYLHPDYTRPY